MALVCTKLFSCDRKVILWHNHNQNTSKTEIKGAAWLLETVMQVPRPRGISCPPHTSPNPSTLPPTWQEGPVGRYRGVVFNS